MQYWIFREPALCFGLPVYLCAAVLFPLHLGWTGASLPALAGYLVIAGALFSVADAVAEPACYPQWKTILSQSLLSLLGLAVPALLAFAIGAAVGPVEERLEDGICAAAGSTETAGAAAEADDVLDMTPDCSFDS